MDSARTVLNQLRDPTHDFSKTHFIAAGDETTVRQMKGNIDNRMTKIQCPRQIESQIQEQIPIEF